MALYHDIFKKLKYSSFTKMKPQNRRIKSFSPQWARKYGVSRTGFQQNVTFLSETLSYVITKGQKYNRTQMSWQERPGQDIYVLLPLRMSLMHIMMTYFYYKVKVKGQDLDHCPAKLIKRYRFTQNVFTFFLIF